MFRVCLSLTLAAGMFLVAHAQETVRPDAAPTAVSDSLLPRNAAGILVDRNLNTFTWTGRALIDTTVAGTRISAREQYSATVIQLESDPSRTLQSNQQQGSFTAAIPVWSQLAAAIQYSSFVFTDSRGIGLSKASMHTVLGGIEYMPIPSLTLSPLAGYRWDNQSDFRDRGPAYQLGATLRPIDLDGYLLNAGAQYHEDRMEPRRLENHFVRAGMEREFTSFTRDSLEIGFYRLRREFYSPDSSIESRQENIFQLANLLTYGTEKSLLASFFFGISSRGLNKLLLYGATRTRPIDAFNTSVDEFHLETYLDGAWHSDDRRSSASVRLSYSERNELHGIVSTAGQTVGPLLSERTLQEESKNNLARRTMVTGRLELPLSWSDLLLVAGSASILRYDTPSALNHEDRDELLVVASIGTLHHMSPVLDLGVTLDGTLSHLVYLLSDRSANNNINRVLRLSPRTTYRPSWFFSTTNGFEVLASYTVYDFEEQASPIRSFSYRQFSWIDSSNVELTDRVGLDFFAYWKLYERGQLKWSEFKERTENSFVDRTLAVQARFSPDPSLLFAVGIRYFSQTRYSYGPPGKQLDMYLRSIGPTCTMLWSPGIHNQVAFRGWYENRRQSDGRIRGLATMTLTLLLNF